ncbi:MAG: ribonuclease P protein component [Chloroherpetonaceae bacterium]|nr:ribonuclease P protein component [Chloroherpetonaceae bacterium]
MNKAKDTKVAGLTKEEIIRSKKELEMLFDKNASSVAVHREGGVKMLCRIKRLDVEKMGMNEKNPSLMETQLDVEKETQILKVEQSKLFRIQALFSVGKRIEPKATRRNRIKRLMREAFRLQKEVIYNCGESAGIQGILQIAFLFVGSGSKKEGDRDRSTKKNKPKLPSYNEIAAWMTKGCEKVIRKVALKEKGS